MIKQKLVKYRTKCGTVKHWLSVVLITGYALCSGSIVARIISNISERKETLTPKILKPELERMITSSTDTTLPFLWKFVQWGLLPMAHTAEI